MTSGAARSQARGRQAELREVLAHRRQEQPVHPLVLHAQHHHDVGALERVVHRRRHAHAEAIEPGRHERRRAARAAPRRPSASAAARSIAARGCASGRRRWRRAARRAGPCARIIVNASSSACVGCSCMPSPALMMLARQIARQLMRRAGRGVAHDDHVGRHRLERARGVGERLALRRRSIRRSSCRACRRSAASRRARTTCASACSARRTD